jgi:hypothetical protein
LSYFQVVQPPGMDKVEQWPDYIVCGRVFSILILPFQIKWVGLSKLVHIVGACQ